MENEVEKRRPKNLFRLRKHIALLPFVSNVDFRVGRSGNMLMLAFIFMLIKFVQFPVHRFSLVQTMSTTTMTTMTIATASTATRNDDDQGNFVHFNKNRPLSFGLLSTQHFYTIFHRRFFLIPFFFFVDF